jgi:hypothetical protein
VNWFPTPTVSSANVCAGFDQSTSEHDVICEGRSVQGRIARVHVHKALIEEELLSATDATHHQPRFNIEQLIRYGSVAAGGRADEGDQSGIDVHDERLRGGRPFGARLS